MQGHKRPLKVSSRTVQIIRGAAPGDETGVKNAVCHNRKPAQQKSLTEFSLVRLFDVTQDASIEQIFCQLSNTWAGGAK